jgi:hypothetical protein
MRGPVILEAPEQHWVCPNCQAAAVTRGMSNRYHRCAGLRGLLAPMVRDGFRGRVFAVEREAYVGREIVTYDGEGRPVSAVVTERPDGSNDVMVNAPCARGATET